jgi:hypothetical protein
LLDALVKSLYLNLDRRFALAMHLHALIVTYRYLKTHTKYSSFDGFVDLNKDVRVTAVLLDALAHFHEFAS